MKETLNDGVDRFEWRPAQTSLLITGCCLVDSVNLLHGGALSFSSLSIEIGEISKVLLLSIAVFVISSKWQTENAWLVLESFSLAGLVIVALFLIGQIGKKELALFRSVTSGRKMT